ncbi:MAG: ABC transporter substrate-binding protein [Pseudomonadota bacterium]
MAISTTSRPLLGLAVFSCWARALLLSAALVALSPDAALAADEDSDVRIALPFGFNTPNPDPAVGWTGWQTSGSGVTETLFWLDLEGQIAPRLAVGAEAVTPTSWEIALRDDVVFHDGTPLDAEAVRFSITRVIDPESPVYNERIASLVGIEDVTVVDSHRVRIETRATNAAFLNDLVDPGLSILSPAAPGEMAVGTGPFRLVEVVPGERARVERFDDYWGGAATASSIELMAINDPATVMLALEAGDIDIAANFPDSDIPRVARRDDLTIGAVPTSRVMYFHMQVNEGPLADPRVRRAIDHLLPRDEIIASVLNDLGGTPGAGIFPPDMPWANQAITPTAYDTAAALDLFAEAGITDTDGDGRLDHDGEPFHLSVRSYLGRPSMQPAAELFMAHLEAAGISTELRVLRDWTVAVDDFRRGDADMLMFSTNAAPTGNPGYFPNASFRTGAVENWSGWSNAEFDALLKEGIATFDDDDRRAIFDRMQAIVAEELPVIIAFYKNRVAVWHEGVQDFTQHPVDFYLVNNALHVDR